MGAAIAGMLLACGLAPPAAMEPGSPDATQRCFGMIALFDRIVQSRLDTRVLQIEPWQLAEARRQRVQAEADCTSGRYWFGISAIEDALTTIGVVPPTAFEEERAD